ncbi:MAG: His/Gly/Thr/Pro-type tRNA ligase C-terminal domain-containing protein [Clostridia bacterium]|nr:His/Gly/Thr/Pro-type tRNA ligase C-terminal domain-containing protein [Clostridia bacterium]
MMEVSKIGLITKKITNLDEQFPVQDMLLQTGQLEQFASGVYAYGHIPFLVKKNVEKVISTVLTKYGCTELSLPVLQPERIWQESGRLSHYVSEGVMFQTKTKNGNYCLAPTAEEAIVNYAKPRLTTYKHLPVIYFQIGQKFRNEIRSRGYLLRGKAFDMMDAYSFGKNQLELDRQYERIKLAYLEIFQQLGLPIQPVGADSGSIGGSKSEEFMCLSDLGEDTILFDTESGKAFNAELLDKDNYQTYLAETYGIKNTKALIKRKAVELGHIFQLGNKYSSLMNGLFVNADGKNCHYVMGCYGIGVSRTVAMLYENSIIMSNGKFSGVALPENIAPYIIYMIPKLDEQEKSAIATKLYQELEMNGIPTLFDDRGDLSIGAKIKDGKLTGAPYLVVLGNSLNDGVVEVEYNRTGEKKVIKIEQFVNYFQNLLKKA